MNVYIALELNSIFNEVGDRCHERVGIDNIYTRCSRIWLMIVWKLRLRKILFREDDLLFIAPFYYLI